VVHRDLIIMLAARHKLRAVYPFSYFAAAGGPPPGQALVFDGAPIIADEEEAVRGGVFP
jgi:hypothetical protein